MILLELSPRQSLSVLGISYICAAKYLVGYVLYNIGFFVCLFVCGSFPRAASLSEHCNQHFRMAELY